MRLIDADALKKELDEQMNFEENCRDSVFDIIDNAPTVDLWEMRQEATENALKKAEVLYERPQGEWITVHFEANELNAPEKSMFDFVKCPFCETIHQGRHNFCSRCGADMRKGGAE